MSTPTPAPIGNITSHVLPPTVVKGPPPIAALARVGSKHRVFEVEQAQPAPVPSVLSEGDDDEDYSVPVVLPGVPVPGKPKSRPAAMDEDEDGGVLADYARVAASGKSSTPAPAPAPAKKHSVNERVLTLGELMAERARQRSPAPAPVLSESMAHTGLASLQLMFPKR